MICFTIIIKFYDYNTSNIKWPKDLNKLLELKLINQLN